MNVWSILTRLVLAWVSLVAAQVAVGALIHSNYPATPHGFTWLMVSDAIVTLAIGIIGLRAPWRGVRLALALYAIAGGIALANLVEGAIFLGHSGINWGPLFVHLILSWALVAIAWAAIFNNDPATDDEPEHRFSVGAVVARVVACSALYVLLYFTAGLIILPHIRDFYATQTVPSAPKIMALQFFFRGPLFMLICLLMMRGLRVMGAGRALLTGVTFALVSGVAPLIMPNPFFPDAVRWFHFGEVGLSNLVFGTAVALIWRGAHQSRRVLAASA